MARFVFEDKSVYYEEYGEGRPIVLLNGIMMSCASWSEFIEPFSANNRLILLDLLDQGRNDSMEGPYSQAIQVEVVLALLDHLGLEQACIAGISYGSEVALRFAIKYPGRVERLALFNATARTGPWLKDIGDGWNLAARDPDSYYLSTIPIIYSPPVLPGEQRLDEPPARGAEAGVRQSQVHQRHGPADQQLGGL